MCFGFFFFITLDAVAGTLESAATVAFIRRGCGILIPRRAKVKATSRAAGAPRDRSNGARRRLNIVTKFSARMQKFKSPKAGPAQQWKWAGKAARPIYDAHLIFKEPGKNSFLPT
jgi:hypothetical protein